MYFFLHFLNFSFQTSRPSLILGEMPRGGVSPIGPSYIVQQQEKLTNCVTKVADLLDNFFIRQI